MIPMGLDFKALPKNNFAQWRKWNSCISPESISLLLDGQALEYAQGRSGIYAR
jgi:hypothetical protein